MLKKEKGMKWKGNMKLGVKKTGITIGSGLDWFN